jgi:hypothetical protein
MITPQELRIVAYVSVVEYVLGHVWSLVAVGLACCWAWAKGKRKKAARRIKFRGRR